jgi:hypothetical protein
LPGFVRLPEFEPERVTVAADVGVMVNVCAADELLQVRVVGLDRPPPLGVMMIVPVYSPFGVTVKLPLGLLT